MIELKDIQKSKNSLESYHKKNSESSTPLHVNRTNTMLTDALMPKENSQRESENFNFKRTNYSNYFAVDPSEAKKLTNMSYFLIITATLFQAINSVFALLLSHIPSFYLLFIRSACFLVILFIFSLFTKENIIRFEKHQRQTLLMYCITNLIIGYAFFKGIASNLKLYEALAIQYSGPMFYCYLNFFLFGISISKKIQIYSLTSVLGILIIFFSDHRDD